VLFRSRRWRRSPLTRGKHYFVPIVMIAILYLAGTTTSVDAFSMVSTSLRKPCKMMQTSRRMTATKEEIESDKEYHRKRRLAKKIASLPKQAAKIYTDYAQRLWQETSTDARELIAKDKATTAIRTVKNIMQGEEYMDFAEDDETQCARQKLLGACHDMLNVLQRAEKQRVLLAKKDTASVAHGSVEQIESKPVVKRASRSVLFGAAMGLVVACWVFSGNWIFTGVFTLMTILGQLEYYRMVMNTGIYPARRISLIGASSMFLTALFAPEFHQICLPMFGLWSMIWFLTMRRKVSSIPEIATTFTGMFYLGFVPSFWVRIRLVGAGREPTRLAPIAKPILEMLGRKASSLPSWIPSAVHLPITTGAIFIFWSWLCLAFNDVGAYFVGRKYGKTKLGVIAPAAGATSPNKSVEGMLGGFAISALLGVIGAWVQKWPYWVLTGAVHGILLGFIGLTGDLTASMLKRDAGLKDFGDLIPEHGGILDRVDGFIWTAPYSWLVCVYIIPALKQLARARSSLVV